MIKARCYIIFFLVFYFNPECLLAQSDNQRIIDSLNEVLRVKKADTSKVNALNLLTSYLRLAGEKQKAWQTADDALQLADKLNYLSGRAGALTNIGTMEYRSAQLTEALEKFKTCVKIYEITGDKTGLGNSYNNIANIYYQQREYPEAEKFYLQALKAYKEAGDTRWTIQTCKNLGRTFSDQGNYPDAFKYFFEGLKKAESSSLKEDVPAIYLNIGEIYVRMMNYNEALENYHNCLAVAEELGKKAPIANAYRAIGEISEKQGNYMEALKYDNKALKMFLDLGNNKQGVASSYNNIGNIYLQISDYPTALQHFNAAMDILKNFVPFEEHSFSYIKIGEVLSRQAIQEKDEDARNKKYNEAVDMLNKGLSIAKKTGIRENIKLGYKVLSDVYAGMNDYKKAMEYQGLYMEIKDSIMNNETTRKLEQQRTQYEVELTEEKLQKEKASEIEKLNNQFAINKAVAEEKVRQEKHLAEQQFNNEKEMAANIARYELDEEKARHLQSMTEQKISQQKKDADAKILLEKEKTDRNRRNELMLIGFGAFLLISVFVALLIRQRNLKRRVVERAEATHKMAELELQSLRAQLNPHFMFNSLNAIQDLILKEDNDRSHLYLSRFSKLLRMLLDNANQPFVSIKQELDFLELYLSLENLRIPDLQFTIEKDEKLNAEKRMIPNMMLQPYIENAIWHGLSHKKENRKLQIRIHENRNATEFEIEDNGVGRKKAEEMKSLYRKGHTSKGMELLSKRFSLLSKEYGAAIRTTTTDLGNNDNATGTVVKIDVPFSLSEQANQFIHDTNHNN